MRTTSSLAFVSLLFLMACSHEQQVASTLPATSAGSQANGGSGSGAAAGGGASASAARLGEPPDAPLYFGFDDATLSTDAKAELRMVGEYMRQGGAVRLVISGNADERGTEEYNLALGDRRAQAAREYLARLGVDISQVKTISYGKLRPAAQGHDEAAWSKNRRDELNLMASRPQSAVN